MFVPQPHGKDFILYLAIQGAKGNQLYLSFLPINPFLAEAAFTITGATTTINTQEKNQEQLVWLLLPYFYPLACLIYLCSAYYSSDFFYVIQPRSNPIFRNTLFTSITLPE